MRRVGVEIEFAGLETGDAARLVAEVFAGTLQETSAHRHSVQETRWGNFSVELDTQYAHGDDWLIELAEEVDDAWLAERIRDGADLESKARELVGNALTGLVPIEIVCPPIPWNELDSLDPLFESLRARGAEGSDASPLYGFGLHLNPEVASLEVAYILAHLRAFILLADRLEAEAKTDITRRLLPHADPFPHSYSLHILDPGYAPNLESLIADYAKENPTRNRGLDLFPLFAHLDPNGVRAAIEDPLIKPRPTFHYRLPDCRLSEPDWSAVTEWNRWLAVEQLAADEVALGKGMAAFADEHGPSEFEDWLDSLGLKLWD